MATIQLRQVEKKFGDAYAVKPMDLAIGDGEFVTLLGPSGCGKTTTLRMIAGLETVSDGAITIGNREVTRLRGRERDVAFVFQLFALYPHLSVYENIAFPLKSQGDKGPEVDARVKQVAAMLGIEKLLKLRPGALSGGDRQRVALARSLVRRPAAFLMDEPLGALDAEFRESMRVEIKKLHLETHATTVYVTHDQVEAMAMSDRVVVMSAAEVQQVATPHEVYINPANTFVARFIGSPGMNLVRGRYASGVLELPGENRYSVPDRWRQTLDRANLAGGEVLLGFRPEAAVLRDGPLAASVYADDLHGSYTMLHLSFSGQADDIINLRANRNVSVPIGTTVRFDLDPDLVRFFDAATGKAL